MRVAEVYGRVLGVVDRQVQMSARAGRDVSATKFRNVQPYCAARMYRAVPRAAWAELPAGPHSSRASVELSGPCRSLSLPDFTSTFIRAFLQLHPHNSEVVILDATHRFIAGCNHPNFLSASVEA